MTYSCFGSPCHYRIGWRFRRVVAVLVARRPACNYAHSSSFLAICARALLTIGVLSIRFEFAALLLEFFVAHTLPFRRRTKHRAT